MIPTDYKQLPDGYWVKVSDGTGPYVRTADNTFALAGTGSGGGGGGGDATAANQVTGNNTLAGIKTSVDIAATVLPTTQTAILTGNDILSETQTILTDFIGDSLTQIADSTESTDNNLAALSLKFPSALGAAPGSASFSVVPASDATFSVAPRINATTSISGTVTTGGTAQNAAASNANRRGFWIQNLSNDDLWVSTLATAVADQPSMRLSAGAYYEAPQGGAGTGAISVLGAVTGQAWAGREY